MTITQNPSGDSRSGGVGADATSQSPIAWHVVRVMTGLLLLTAAGLKAHELAMLPVPADGLITSRPLLIAIVEYELLLGAWLLGGKWPRQARLAALVTFVLFAIFALVEGWLGKASCGCFGMVQVNPWITLSIDAAAVIALALARPRHAAHPGTPVNRFNRLEYAGLGAVILLGALAGGWMYSYTPATLDVDDLLAAGDGSFVPLEPGKWVGTQLPILPFIDIGQQLGSSEWLVVLYRHDCTPCREALPEYEREAGELAGRNSPRKVALIEMPPYASADNDPVPPDSACIRGRLSEDHNWFVPIPVAMEVHNGIVRSVRR